MAKTASSSTGSTAKRLQGKRRALALGFVAVFVPLAVLLLCQYRWLGQLEESSAAAQKVLLDKQLGALAKETSLAYWKDAERVLSITPVIFEDYFPKMGRVLAKKSLDAEGIRRLFVVRYERDDWAGRVYTFNPETQQLEEPDGSRESLSIYAATAPWRVLRKDPATLETELSVDERNPDNPIVLRPVTDDEGDLVGLVGMILDRGHFVSHVLPAAIREARPRGAGGEPLEVCVHDARGEQVLPSGGQPHTSHEIRRNLPWVFTGWKVGIYGYEGALERLARANFTFNVTLSVALAAVLLGGVLLALRTASREIALSEMKSDFVSNVSHELRTPLASIRVFGELQRLGRVASPEKVEEYGEYIETESRRLTQLINNILDFSKIESGGKVYRFEDGDLGQVLREVARTFQVRLAHSGFALDLDLPAAFAAPLRFDAGAVAQAVSNLLDNALKYSALKGSAIEHSAGRDSADGESQARSGRIGLRLQREGRWAVVTVEDEGIGISRDEQPKIFERFHRVGTGLVHDVKGSGLGLAIVRHIAEAHGGRVEVESEPGRGSTFRLRLPVARAGSAAAASDPSLAPGVRPQESS